MTNPTCSSKLLSGSIFSKIGNHIFYDISCHIYHLVCAINCKMANEYMTLTDASNLYLYHVDYLFIHELIIFLSDVMLK